MGSSARSAGQIVLLWLLVWLPFGLTDEDPKVKVRPIFGFISLLGLYS
jgi:hypothetical protein